MAKFNSDKVLTSILTDPDKNGSAINPLSSCFEVQAQVFNLADEWIKKPHNRIVLRHVDRSGWPGIVNAALNSAIRLNSQSEFKRHMLLADTSRIEKFSKEQNFSAINLDQEFSAISGGLEVRSPSSTHKVFSAPSSQIIITKSLSQYEVSICESVAQIQTLSSLAKDDKALLLRWIGANSTDGYQGVIRSIAEFEVWYHGNKQRSAFFTNALSPEESKLREVRTDMLSLNYKQYELQDCETFKTNLRKQKFIHIDDFLAIPADAQSSSKLQRVKVADIIAAKDEGKGWDLEDRGTDYVYKMAQAIIDGRFIANRPPALFGEYPDIVLAKRGDKYGVTTNGRHRVAALKGLDPELMVWASVSRF